MLPGSSGKAYGRWEPGAHRGTSLQEEEQAVGLKEKAVSSDTSNQHELMLSSQGTLHTIVPRAWRQAVIKSDGT